MQQLLESGAIQAKLRISQPGDVDELEADRVANHMVHSQQTPTLQRKCSCSGGASCAKCEDEEMKGIHRKAVSPLAIHRAASDPFLPRTDETGAKPSHRGLSRPSQLIVEDNAKTIEHGQMRKSEFLKLMRSAVCTTADAALASVKHSTKACPYIEKWLAFYSDKYSIHIERALTKYAPEAARARTAREYISILNTRVERAVLNWAKTGKLTGVPDELASQFLPGASPGGFLGAVMSFASSSVGSSILGFLGGSGKKREDSSGEKKEDHGSNSVQRKESGAVKPVAPDAHTVKSQLGSGQALDSRVQSQMSSAFSYDFSRVRVHTDSQSAALSADLNAKAFTIGQDVAFGTGEYRPGTPVGDVLIAHELAHVVQQGGGQASAPLTKNSNDNGPLEQDADSASLNAVAALWTGSTSGLANLRQNAMPRLRSGLSLQRCSKDHDLEIQGVSNANDPDSIFFDRNSSDVEDQNQQEKLSDLKQKLSKKSDLTLFSFVSEDENSPPEKGLKLAADRFKKVDKELRRGSNAHEGGQKAELDTTSSKGNLNYRKMRKVSVKPAGESSGESNCSAGGEVPCPTPSRFSTAQGRALTMLDVVIPKLSGPLSSDVRTLLKQRFGAEGPNLPIVAAAVKSNLTNLKNHIHFQMDPVGHSKPAWAPGHHCTNECDAACGPRTAAYNQGKDAQALMTLCVNSGSGFMGNTDLDSRASILVHEGLHGITLASVPIGPPPAFKGTKDFSYHGQRLIKFLDTATALKNTDSYVLVVQALNGMSPSVGPDSEDPEVSDDFFSTGAGGEREQVDRALAWLEGWLVWSRQEASGAYGELDKRLRTGAWANAHYEEVYKIIAPLFGLTVPPTAPKDSDKFALAAIYDRLLVMSDVLFNRSSIELEKSSKKSTAWNKIPGQHVRIGKDFFKLPEGAGKSRAQLDLLLDKLIEAHPDISSDFRPKYVRLIDALRKHFGGGAP
ncbi:MAG TPA: DUF4157 domain-containing protein [Candidatus Saccharimonadales bacterium]|nr:DUF4157 domain-containing protein [Candidatus Saccharimonadales bacterium]